MFVSALASLASNSGGRTRGTTVNFRGPNFSGIERVETEMELNKELVLSKPASRADVVNPCPKVTSGAADHPAASGTGPQRRIPAFAAVLSCCSCFPS